MILGISSYTFGWAIGFDGSYPVKPMTEADLINLALQSGVSCVQIGDNLPLHTISEERLSSLRTLAGQHSIRLELGARKLTPNNLERYIELSAAFYAPLLRFVIDGEDYEPDVKTIISLLSEYSREFEKRGITLGIENHDRLKAKELALIMDRVNSPSVGVCLDCVNSMGAGEGLEYVANILAPYTVNLHIKDFTATRLPHKMGFTITGAPAGQGLTNVPLLLELILPYGRCKSAVLEQWVPPDIDLELTLRKEREWAAKGIEYLKSLNVFTTTQKQKT